MKELITVNTKLIERAIVKEESAPVFVYKNGEKTEEISAYKIKFLVMDSNNPMNMRDFVVKFDENHDFEVGKKVRIEFDDEKTKVYASTKKDSTFANVEVSLYGKKVALEERNNA